MKTLNISEGAFIKLLSIRENRKQDKSRAETFDYILRVFEESPLRITERNHPLQKPRTPGSASPIIDADNLRIVTPTKLAEMLYADKIRTDNERGLARIALKAVNESPTKNNLYKEK